MDQFYNYF